MVFGVLLLYGTVVELTDLIVGLEVVIFVWTCFWHADIFFEEHAAWVITDINAYYIQNPNTEWFCKMRLS